MLPKAAQARDDGIVDRDLWVKAADQGYLCSWAEEQHGGLGLNDFRFDQILCEELCWRDPGFFIHLHNRIVGPYLGRLGTDDQKETWLPKVTSGEAVLAIAMTEPGTGSDLSAIQTRAEKQDDGWVLNGSKTYISNGISADLIIVVARTVVDNPYGLGLFLITPDMAGFSRGRNLKKLGLHAQDTAELFFDNIKVPHDRVLGAPDGAFKHMMEGLAEERLMASIGFVAKAERAFAITMDFINERKVFGKPVGSFQNSRFTMADLRTKIDVAWSFIDHCVLDHNDGALSAELAAEAKLFTSEIECEVADRCLQLHGGAGYMEEYEISRIYADARVSKIYAGSNEIMKEIIGRKLGLDERNLK